VIKVSTVKRLLGMARKAIQDYDMIQEGDRIAIGVSGGKDSLCLLYALGHLRHFYPVKFELEAITLDLGFGKTDTTPIKDLCDKLGVRYTVEETNIGKIVFDIRKEKNPCSMCANLRRGALDNAAKRLNCNKVALGHNRDDVIETALLSMFYEGRFHTFSPVTYLDRTELYLIRPLIYIEEKEIKGFVNKAGLTVVPNPCPNNGFSKRQYVKELIRTLNMDNKNIKSNLFGAIKRSGIEGWRLK